MKTLKLLLISSIFLFSNSCSENIPTPCDCKFLEQKKEYELTVNEQEIFYTYCRDVELQVENFIDPDKPYEYAIQEWKKYIQNNCPD
jgi:hypothetical protein